MPTYGAGSGPKQRSGKVMANAEAAETGGYITNAPLVEERNHKNVARETVCFGRVTDISATCGRLKALRRSDLPRCFQAKFDSSDRFTSKDIELEIKGHIVSDHGQMIQGLLDEPSLQLHVEAFSSGDSETNPKNSGRVYIQHPCTLNITVYGPLNLFDEIGSWFQEYEIYLQDPIQVGELDVRYCNPHRLSFEGLESCPLLSEFINHNSKPFELPEILSQPDLLETLSCQADLEEAPQPTAISASLKRHQRQALTFMIRREQGWAFDEKDADIWEAKDTNRGLWFLNKVNGAYEREEPPALRGGIVADPMGLGKTLTMIALAASDVDMAKSQGDDFYDHEVGKNYVNATLIIVPPPLLGTWEEQLSE
ncbi:hypothetical protein VPNG_01634 [Cytospora leucostoma]|uniref:SNF2 N-terminal domain-containing protein n=1 Tax=Cytospora leucostoma TaxID=1230097 RepID=A0A423XJN1_9PEZI|nr:hypothetical protein VPNG_01634 [Cytospora leucostoma]